jgi:hypothetical protein
MDKWLSWCYDLISLHDSEEKAKEFMAVMHTTQAQVLEWLDTNYPLKGLSAKYGKPPQAYDEHGWVATRPKDLPEHLRDYFSALDK